MHTHTTSHTRSYGHTLAHALLSYANTNPSFADWLVTTLLQIEHPSITTPATPCTTPGLAPKDDTTALRRAAWLLDACVENRLPGSEEALATLATWSRTHEREDPKAILLGFDVGWLPVGVMGKTKKKYEPMDVLLRADVAQKPSLQLTRTLTALTHRVVEKGLIMAGGHTGKLEPELGDWLFGDKHLALYTAPREVLDHLTQHVEKHNIPYAHEHDTTGTSILALSPALYLFDLPDNDRLVPMES